MKKLFVLRFLSTFLQTSLNFIPFQHCLFIYTNNDDSLIYCIPTFLRGRVRISNYLTAACKQECVITRTYFPGNPYSHFVCLGVKSRLLMAFGVYYNNCFCLDYIPWRNVFLRIDFKIVIVFSIGNKTAMKLLLPVPNLP